MRLKPALLLTPALLLLPGAARPADGLLPGLWQERFRIEFIDTTGKSSPDSAPQDSAERNCYSAADVAALAKILLEGAENLCTIANFSMHDGKIGMDMSCRFAADATYAGRAEGTYSSDAYALEGIMHPEGSFHGMDVRASMSANRLGACPKE